MYPPEECIVEVLDVWLRNYDCDNTDASMIRKPTWWDVARALREIELHQLANNILSLCKDGKSLLLESGKYLCMQKIILWVWLRLQVNMSLISWMQYPSSIIVSKLIVYNIVVNNYVTHSDIPLANDELPPPLPPKVINLDEEMEPLPQQEELGTPPPLPPPYNETSLKQTWVHNSPFSIGGWLPITIATDKVMHAELFCRFCSSVPPIPPKNNLQT